LRRSRRYQGEPYDGNGEEFRHRRAGCVICVARARGCGHRRSARR
jgi:hypothetical protein